MIKKKDKETKGELIFGIHPVVELLKAKRRKLISVYTTKPTPQAFGDIQRVWPKYPVPIQYVAREVLDRMVGTADHQSVVAWTQAFPFRKTFFDPKKHKVNEQRLKAFKLSVQRGPSLFAYNAIRRQTMLFLEMLDRELCFLTGAAIDGTRIESGSYERFLHFFHRNSGDTDNRSA